LSAALLALDGQDRRDAQSGVPLLKERMEAGRADIDSASSPE